MEIIFDDGSRVYCSFDNKLTSVVAEQWNSALRTAASISAGAPQAKVDFHNMTPERVIVPSSPSLKSSFISEKRVAAPNRRYGKGTG